MPFFITFRNSYSLKTTVNMLRAKNNEALQGLASFSRSLSQCRRLEGKTAVITASTQGIGFSIARRLAQEGAKVIVSSRKKVNVDNAVEKLKAEGLDVWGITCHVAKAEDRGKLLNEVKSKYGRLDILVLNAAISPLLSPMLECTESAWDKLFEINVKSYFLMLKESLPLLKESKSSSVTIVSSIAGYQPFELIGVYSITKTALLALCKVAAQELSKDGIRVNCIAPGIIQTKFSETFYASEDVKNVTLSTIPLQRLGTTDEIGSIAAFLASDDASYITGETIVAAGGMKSRL